MTDILDSAVSWLDGVRKANMSRSVTYSRGNSSVAINATLGSSLLKLGTEFGERIERTEADFIFSASDLVLSGKQVPPTRGDIIATVFYGQTWRFEVRPPEGEPPWRYADAHEIMVRVHCKRVA